MKGPIWEIKDDGEVIGYLQVKADDRGYTTNLQYTFKDSEKSEKTFDRILNLLKYQELIPSPTNSYADFQLHLQRQEIVRDFRENKLAWGTAVQLLNKTGLSISRATESLIIKK